MAVGGPGYSTNRGYVEITDVGTAYSSYQTLYGNDTSDRFGEAIEAGDVNGDGRDELIVGAPSAENQGGKVFVFHQVVNTSANKR